MDPRASEILRLYREEHLTIDGVARAVHAGRSTVRTVLVAHGIGIRKTRFKKGRGGGGHRPKGSKTRAYGWVPDLEGSPGWIFARFIRLAADRVPALAIYDDLSSYGIVTLEHVQLALRHRPNVDRVKRCRSFKNPHNRRKYLDGLALNINAAYLVRARRADLV